MIFTDNVATLIHDMKNPLIAQERIFDLLLQNAFGELNDMQAEIILQVKESCLYLKNIVRNAMDNYVSNSEKININCQRFNILEIVKFVVEELKPLSDMNCKEIIVSCPDILVFADKFQIKRVITNLLGNAIKYSINNSKIEIIAKQSDNKFYFSIKNLSEPIKNLDRVFEKFESTSNSGLGLFLVKQIITAHSGKVFAQKECEGTYSFGFVIPNV